MKDGIILIYLYVFFIGCCFGSFFNLCIYRIPRKQSIVFPGSHCTSCNKRLGALDLIPVFSYVLGGGKCRFCKASFSSRYLLMELVWGFIFLLPFHRFQLELTTAASIIVLSVMLLWAMLNREAKLLNGHPATLYKDVRFVAFLALFILMLL